jgi:hypothetical protein
VAGLIDCCVVAAVGGLALVIGHGLSVAGTAWPTTLVAHLINAATVALAGTIVLAGCEASTLEATPGKLARGLRVRRYPGAERLGFGRALVRNLVKLGLPLPLAYLAGLAAYVGGGLPAWVGVAAAGVVALSYLVDVLLGDGRTAYDQVSGSMVIATMPGRRYA